MTTTTLVARARSRGSKATSHAAAMRYLRTHLPGPSEAWRAWRQASGVPAPRWGYSHRVARPIGWTHHNHRMRLDARYGRLAAEWMSATGLPLLDPKREQARVSRAARQAQLAAARESTEERELTEAGYVLTRAGQHQTFTGMDDGHPFSATVPLRCQTIGEALRWLRPDGVAEDALRQGEWFFVPATPEPEGYTESDAGSRRRVEHHVIESFDARGRHQVAECLVVIASGETAFVGRRAVKTHDWTGRPRVYARGLITHPEHVTVDLGPTWHEVIPNRPHGPFAVGSLGIGGMD